jgi:hypothetical protein
MLKTCSDVSISTVFRAENFSGVSTSTASPAGSCTGVFYRTIISCRKAVRASHAGRLKWPIHGLNRYCRKISVAYLKTLPLVEGWCGVSTGRDSSVRKVKWAGSDHVFQCRHTTIFLVNTTRPALRTIQSVIHTASLCVSPDRHRRSMKPATHLHPLLRLKVLIATHPPFIHLYGVVHNQA